MYEVYLEKAAENDLKRLPTTTFHRIIPHIKALAENPRPSSCRKLTGSKNDWRIRIGDYRVLYVSYGTDVLFSTVNKEVSACFCGFGSSLHKG